MEYRLVINQLLGSYIEMETQSMTINSEITEQEQLNNLEINSSNLMVNIENLKKYFGNIKAVDGINLQISKGSIFGFLGPNGAGKTTTINSLITLIKPTAGEGTIAGYDLYDISHIRTKVAAVFQEQTLDETLTGLQNLRLHAELYQLPKYIREERITELVEMVGLTDRLKDPVIKYSGGMRRRLEIARGLLTRPTILFLDEPTTGLDPQSRQHIWEKIKEIRERDNITIFITTHYMEEAEALCDHIAIIDQGKIIAEGTADELKSSLGQDFIIVDLADKIDLEEATKRVTSLDYVQSTKIDNGKLYISIKNASRFLAPIVQSISTHDNGSKYIEITNIESKKPTLNDVFLYFTGKELRDEEADLADRLKMAGRKGGSRRMGMMGRRH